MRPLRLLVLAGGLDAHGQALVRELATLGSLSLHGVSAESLPESLCGTLVPAPRADHDLVYCLLDPAAPLPETARKFLAGTALPVVLDAARLPLSARGQDLARDWRDLRAQAVLVREEAQRAMLDGGEEAGGGFLVLPDYLRFSFLPRLVLADIRWQVCRAAGQDAGETPPSRRLELLLDAPAGDAEAERLAAQTLDLDPLFTPALLRLTELAAGPVPEDLRRQAARAADQDHLSFLHDLALLRHLPADHARRSGLEALRDHVFPPRPAGRKRILLVVVYKQRDFFIDLLLGRHLEALGHEVIMRPLSDSTCPDIVELVPDAVIWGAKTTPHQVKLARFAKDRGVLSIVRREEGVIYGPLWRRRPAKQKSFTLGGVDYSPFVDLEIGYNGDFRQTIAAEGHLPADRVLAVGAMPFDIYFVPGLERVLPGRRELLERLGLDPDKKLLLLATSWSYADRDPHTAIPEAGPAAEKAHQEAVEAVRHAREGRRAWFELAESFCRDFGAQWNVLVKVHPGEKVEAYQRWIEEKKLPARAILSGYLVEILRHTDLLVHAGSTSSIEAHFLGVPSVAYWVTTMLDHPLYQVIRCCNSYAEFKEFFQGLRLGRSNMAEDRLRFVEEGFYGTTDGRACRRAALAVDALLRAAPCRPFRYPADRPAPYRDPDKDPYGTLVTRDEVEHYVRRIRAVLGPDADR